MATGRWRAEQYVGVGALVLGAAGPDWHRLGMGWDAGAGLVLAGAILLAPLLSRQVWRKWLQAGCLALLIALSSVMLRLGRFDLADLGLVAFTFAILALATLQGRVAAGLVRGCTALVILAAAIGGLSDALRLEETFQMHGLTRMAPATAFGILALGFGLRLYWREAEWNQVVAEQGQGRRIVSVATVVLLVVVATTAVSGLVLLQGMVINQAAADLQLRLRNRSSYVRLAISSAQQRAEVLAHRRDYQAGLAQVRPGTRLELPSGDFSAIELLDAGGRPIASAGVPALQATAEVALDADSELLWEDGFLLRRRFAVPQGTLVTEQPLGLGVGTDATGWGATGELGLCGPASRASDELVCFPQRLRPSAYRIPRTLGSELRPVALALQGGSGVAETLDYRDHRVLEAFGPIAGNPLGLVAKMDTYELYAPLRRHLEFLLPLLGLLTLAGLEIMRWQVRPLVAQLVRSRNQAQASEARFRAAAESGMDAFFIFDAVRGAQGEITDFRLNYVNPNGARFAALEPDSAIGRGLSEFSKIARAGGFLQKFTEVLETRHALQEEFAIQPWSGPPYWLYHQAVPLGDGVAVTVRDITERKRQEERLTRLAHNDTLTGLANRQVFMDRLEHAMATSRRLRSQDMLALLYLDLDGFKEINDDHGHTNGDQLLRVFAQRLSSCIRNTDTAARLGGDEFTILLENLDGLQDGERVVAAIFDMLRQPIALSDGAVTITSSVGVAFYRGEDITAEELVRRADSALYKAKRAGRNTFRMFKTAESTGA